MPHDEPANRAPNTRFQEKIAKLKAHESSAEKIGSYNEAKAFRERIHRLEREHGIGGIERSLVAQIRETWGDTKDKNFKVARLLLDLKPRKRTWNSYGLPFAYSWGKKLIKIAKDSRIPVYFDDMPESRTALYEIALLNNKLFAEALQERIINPSASREDIRAWVRLKRGVPVESAATITLKFRSVGLERQALDEILDRVEECRTKYGALAGEARTEIRVSSVKTHNFASQAEEDEED